MAEYELTSPKGEKYMVTAPEGATGEQVMQYFHSNRPQEPAGRQYSKKESGFLGAADAATMGFSDEILAGVNAAPHVLDGSYKENYSRNLENVRKMQRDAQEQNPWSYGGGQVAGSVASAAGLAKAAPSAARAVSNFVARNPVLGASTVGGVSGGVYGFGSGEGTAQDRADEGLEGAGVGALGGAILSRLAPMVGDIAQSAGKKVSGLLSKPVPVNSVDDVLAQTTKEAPFPDIDTSAPAMKKVMEAIKKDYPKSYNQVFRMWKEGDKSLAEFYGPQTRSLAKGAAQYPSGQASAEKFFGDKIVNSPDRIKESVARNIDPTTDIHTQIEQIVSHGRQNAAPLYERAYMKTINPGVDVFNPLDNILSKPEIQQAINKARRKFPSELADLPDESVKVLDYAKRILDDDISTAQRGGQGNFARSRTELKNELLAMMDEQVPLYKQARESSGDYLSVKAAIENGMKYKNVDPEVLGKTFQKMSDNEKIAYKAGVSKSIRDAIDNTIDGSNPFNRIFGKEQDRKRLEKILSPKEFTDLGNELKAEDRLYKMRNEILGGSPTTGKAMAAAQIAAGGADVLASMSSGGIASVPKNAMISFISKAFDGISDRSAGIISDILYETDPSKKVLMLERLSGSKHLSPSEYSAVKEAYFKTNDLLSARAKGAIAGGVILNRPMTNNPNSEGDMERRPFLKDAQGATHYYP